MTQELISNTRRLVVGICCVIVSSWASAQPWPAKPIRIVLPYPAGGALDFTARTIGERLAKSLGQAVIIDNKAGASGVIGTADVARAEPDGYTLLFSVNDTMINNVVLLKALPYDPLRDFVFIAQVLRSPTLLSVSPKLGVKNFAEFRALTATGAKLSYGSWGIGGLGHLAGESLNRELRADMVHVPQRGEALVIQDVLSGTVDVGLSSVGSARQHVAAGKLVPLAVMAHDRVQAMPNVPTMRELGFQAPIYETAIWMAFLAPAKTPPAIVQRLGAEIRVAANLPEVRQALLERGFEMFVTTPEQANAGYRQEFESTTKVMRALGIEAQ